MIDVYEEIDFEAKVYYVDYEEDEVVEATLAELIGEYADMTTSPCGVEPRLHMRNNGERDHYILSRIESDEGWEVWTWGHAGNNPEMVREFETKEEAEHALKLFGKYDLDNNCNAPCYYFDKDSADEELAESREEQEDE